MEGGGITMAEGNKVTYPCPGHEGKCVFCKSEYGLPRSVGEMPEIDRLTGKRKVDCCCKACSNNYTRSHVKQFNRTSVS